MTVPIFPHANLDGLMNALSGEWGARREGPLPLPVVVPSVAFSDHLQLCIARERGVCMGFQFLTPQSFISRAFAQRESLWSKRFLCWEILPHVARFAADLGVSNPAARDRYAMAELIADRFDQYAHFRPEIIRRWAAATDTPGADWQERLWRELRLHIPEPHPALEIERLKADPDFRAKLVGAFPKLLVLGTGAIDPLLIDVLGLLAEAGGEVKVHIVLPSLEYLGDLKRRQALPVPDTDPESIEAQGGHPLLESMGRHAIGSFLLLGKLDEQYTHWPEAGQSEATGSGFLQRLQADIRALRTPTVSKKVADDVSVRVHSCFGPRREMEVLRGEILRAFEEIPDLKPEEIHIVTPSLDIYAPLVSAVLEPGGVRLPVRLTELPPSETDPVIAGALALLEMAMAERYEASRLLEMLQMNAVQAALEISEDDRAIECVRNWIRDSGLTQGLGESEPGSWVNARDRLIAGRWFGEGDDSKYSDGDFILPVADQLGGDQELMERFIAWHARLESIFEEWRVEATPAAWSDLLTRACTELLAGEEDSLLEIQPHLSFLQGLECIDLTDAGAILDWLSAESAEAGRRGNVSGRVTFGRFKQLQNIPCRVLAMVGMQEGDFPGQNRVPAWDLLRSEPRVWDRNARVDDRQLFLDALLTVSDRLIITAANRNVRSGKDEPLSPCVDELLRVAGQMGVRRNELIIEHRLHPFAAEYFEKSNRLPQSFDPVHAEAATALAAGNRVQGIPFYTGSENIPADEAKETQDLEITIRQLVDFWKDPAKAYLRTQGVTLAWDEEDEEELDRVPLTLDTLQAWKIKDAVVKEIIAASTTLEHAEAKMRAGRALPPGNLGSRTWEDNRVVSEPIGTSVKARRSEDMPVDLQIEGARIIGTMLTADVGQKLLAYRVGKFDKPKNLIEPWIQAVVAAANGLEMPFVLIDEDNPDSGKEYPAIEQKNAQTTLAYLVLGFRQGQQFPLAYGPATSDAYATKFKKTSDQAMSIGEASEAWKKEAANYGSGGESHEPAAKIVWRDRDAFADPQHWVDWAEAIAIPLHEWKNPC